MKHWIFFVIVSPLSLLFCDIVSISVFFITLILFKTEGHIILSIWLFFFLMLPHDQTVLADFEEENHIGEVLSSLPHIRSSMILRWLIPNEVNLDHFTKVAFARFVLYKVLFFPFSLLFFGSKSLSLDHQPTLTRMEISYFVIWVHYWI